VRKAVLIVDDVSIARRRLRQLLEQHLGCDIICLEAENGQEAVGQAGRSHLDLVILKFSMPAMNGLALTRLLKQMQPRVPIIMASVYKDRTLEQCAFDVGVGAVISTGDETGRLIHCAHILLKYGGSGSSAEQDKHSM
jgi:two-component system invasion response regulator UvrY